MVSERPVWPPAFDTARSTLRTDCVTEVLGVGAGEGAEAREAGADIAPVVTVLVGPVAVLPPGTDSSATNPGACSLGRASRSGRSSPRLTRWVEQGHGRPSHALPSWSLSNPERSRRGWCCRNQRWACLWLLKSEQSLSWATVGPTQAMRGNKSGSVRTGPSASPCLPLAVSSTVGAAGVQAGACAGAPAPPMPPFAPPLPLADGPTSSPVGVWNERPAKPRSTTSPTNMASASAVRRCAPASSKRRRARGFSRRTTAEDPRASWSRFARSPCRRAVGADATALSATGARVGWRGADSGGDTWATRSSSAGTLPPAWAAIVLKRSLARSSAFLRVPGNSQLEDRSNSSAWWARSSLVQARRRALTLGSAQSASVVESSPSRCTRRTAKARQTSSYRRRRRQ